jgi:TPR repeat protein
MTWPVLSFSLLDAGEADGAGSLAHMYAVGHGVTRSKQMAMRWVRKGADIGLPATCLQLARLMYENAPYARKIGTWWGPQGPPGSPLRLGSWQVTTSRWTSSLTWYIGYGSGGVIRSTSFT